MRRSPRPGRAQVDALHALYVERLTRLFEEHKERYGVLAYRHLVLTQARRRLPSLPAPYDCGWG